jgi:superfamily II DNA helicase RecQ
MGKTFLALFVAKEFEPTKTTILILPFCTLHMDIVWQARDHGVLAAEWPAISMAGAQNWQIVHVSIEHAVQASFVVLAETLIATGRLKRIWGDEVHLALLHSNFCIMLNDLGNLRKQVQLVLFTATLPPDLEPALWEAYCTQPGLVICTLSECPNHKLSVISAGLVSDGIKQLVANVERCCTHYRTTSRGIIITNTVDKAVQVAALLGLECFHGGMADDQKRGVYNRWHSGKHQVVVGTTAFTHGVDLSEVLEVWWLGRLHNMLTAAQARGRSGQSGQPSRFTIYDIGATFSAGQDTTFGSEALTAVAWSDQLCHRLFFSVFLGRHG